MVDRLRITVINRLIMVDVAKLLYHVRIKYRFLLRKSRVHRGALQHWLYFFWHRRGAIPQRTGRPPRVVLPPNRMRDTAPETISFGT